MTTSLSDGGSIAVGLVLAAFAGFLNGSWNVSFSPTHGCAVGKSSSSSSSSITATTTKSTPTNGETKQNKISDTLASTTETNAEDTTTTTKTTTIMNGGIMTTTTTKETKEEGEENETESTQQPTAITTTNNKTTVIIDLSYHHAWLLYQVYAASVNIPICIWLAGGIDRVNYIVQETSVTSIFLIILFSLLWGIGSVGFGLAIKIAGVGLGTNLCTGVIMVFGTFLPLCLDRAITTPAGGVVIAGLIVCCIGLSFSVKSLQTRDADERRENIRRRTVFNTTVSLKQLQNLKDPSSLDELQQQQQQQQAAENDNDDDVEEQENGITTITSSTPVDSNGKSTPSSLPPNKENTISTDTRHNDDQEYSTFYKVSVCLIAGLFATQLQFAFVFGQETVDLAKDNEHGPGSTPASGTSAVIWLFAISLGAPVSIVYGLYSCPSHIPMNTMWKCPWYRHILIILSTSIPWVTHIHLYGYANTLLPSEIAASVAWPIVMMMTVVAGILWSLALGEWKHASLLARRYLYRGLLIVTLGVGIIMASVAVS